MATAGTGTYGVGGTTVYSSMRGCTTFMVHVVESSANPALVNVGGLHAAADFITIRPGNTLVFRRQGRGIQTVFIKGSGGDVDADWGVVAKVS